MILFKKQLLAIEVSGNDIRAAIVQQKGTAVEIIDFTSMKRSDPEDDLPSVEAIRALAQRLQHTAGPAVFITPLARAFELFMDRKKVAGLKHYQLMEAVKWEVEPYTGINGANALIGVEPEQKPERLPGEVVAEEEQEQVVVNVSAIERNVYRAIKERFRAAGFLLKRIYPPDVCFYMPLLMDGVDSPRAILEVGQDYSNFAIVRGGIAKQINTLSLSLESIQAHLSGEMISRDLVESLRFTVRQTPEPEPLILSGPGAARADVVSYIADYCPNGARALILSRVAGIMDAREDPVHAPFGTVVGAAVREFRGRRDRRIGIDDRAPIVPKLKKSAYMAPLATTVVVLILLFGHYRYMKHKDTVYKKQIVQLTSDLKARKADVAEYEKLIQESDRIEEEIAFAKRKIAYIEGRADEDLGHIVACLEGIARGVPDSIVLSSIVQKDLYDYTVTGSASDLPAVGEMATRLQTENWCKSAALKKLERNGAQPFGIDFELSIKTGDEKA